MKEAQEEAQIYHKIEERQKNVLSQNTYTIHISKLVIGPLLL